jgi:hypothetical protein
VFAIVGVPVDGVTLIPDPAVRERIPVFAIVAADDVPPTTAIPPVPVPNVAVAGAMERTPPVAVTFTTGAVAVPVIETPVPALTDVTAFPLATVDLYAQTESAGLFARTIGATELPIYDLVSPISSFMDNVAVEIR